ncbi:LOG family protein [Methyloligella solikamskensis]|uniref:AMP nucleosidase n=1 Tax=Methyloligella solikamskensis TaxID=1177756 RepID=A0ABW3JBY6_9HYPH
MNRPEDILDDEEASEEKGRTHRLAFEDLDFLRSDEMRPLRLALEFSKADLALQKQGIASTVVVFGSHRVLSPEQAEEALKAAQDEASRKRAEHKKRMSVWYEEARHFALIVSERGGALAIEGDRHNVIATGAGPGIMEAANRGAAEAGAPTIGFNIALPEPQEPNRFITPELTFRFRYFGIRKMHFAMRANALAVFPGGFGTLDELFEILTLRQSHKYPPMMPVILFCRDYWRSIVNFEALAEFDMIGSEDAKLFEFVDSAEEAWEVMLAHGVLDRAPLPEV